LYGRAGRLTAENGGFRPGQFGICCGLGVMVTPISQVAPFLLLGIGVDDMFVIVRTLERIPTSLSTEERIRLTYRRCGGAIAVTSFTDALAFLVGATIKFPAMRAFCINAGVGVLVTFGLQVTFMAAVIAINDAGVKGKPSWGDRQFRKIRGVIDPGSVQYYDAPPSDAAPDMPSNAVRTLFLKTLSPFVENGSVTAHIDEGGAVASCNVMCCPYRDAPYKRERGERK
jgi:predicted RND superfamily exporter protein